MCLVTLVFGVYREFFFAGVAFLEEKIGYIEFLVNLWSSLHSGEGELFGGDARETDVVSLCVGLGLGAKIKSRDGECTVNTNQVLFIHHVSWRRECLILHTGERMGLYFAEREIYVVYSFR